nr:hypothetical protein [Actinomycetota bacterium]
LVAVATFAWLHRRLYALVWRRRGPRQAVAAVPLHLLHSLVAVVAVPLGVAAWALGQTGSRSR